MATRPEVHNPPFQWPFVLSVVEKRLGMWVGRPTYERAVAMVIGFDMAQPESINGAMQMRVAERLGTGAVAWPWALMRDAIGEDPKGSRDLNELSPDEDELAIARLVRELREVLQIAETE
jgi:hypothetical protein